MDFVHGSHFAYLSGTEAAFQIFLLDAVDTQGG